MHIPVTLAGYGHAGQSLHTRTWLILKAARDSIFKHSGLVSLLTSSHCYALPNSQLCSCVATLERGSPLQALIGMHSRKSSLRPMISSVKTNAGHATCHMPSSLGTCEQNRPYSFQFSLHTCIECIPMYPINNLHIIIDATNPTEINAGHLEANRHNYVQPSNPNIFSDAVQERPCLVVEEVQ
jgi:hypothetical protein